MIDAFNILSGGINLPHANMTDHLSLTPAAAVPSAILTIRGLSFRTEERMLFDKVTIAITAGVTLMCGDEGTGKTTLLRLLAADLAAEAGDLRVGDILFSAQPEAYRQHVFWADPRTNAFDHTTPREYFKTVQQAWPAFNDQMLDASIAGLSLGPHLDKKLFMLSTGSKRKVWLAAGFSSGATVLLIDEPFVALDGASIAFVVSLLKHAEGDPSRACVIANYVAPGGVALAGIIDLNGFAG